MTLKSTHLVKRWGESPFGADLGENGKAFKDEQRVIESLLSSKRQTLII